jgi:hypothetical protein
VCENRNELVPPPTIARIETNTNGSLTEISILIAFIIISNCSFNNRDLYTQVIDVRLKVENHITITITITSDIVVGMRCCDLIATVKLLVRFEIGS